jgi:hypothetical protein
MPLDLRAIKKQQKAIKKWKKRRAQYAQERAAVNAGNSVKKGVFRKAPVR